MSRPLAIAIVNPTTGRRGLNTLVAMLRDELSHCFKPVIRVSEHAGHALELARTAARASGLVIAVGGDGTVSQVAAGLQGSSAKLGIVPAGTANVIARGLGIPHDLTRATRLLCEPHHIRVVDALKLDDRLALHVIGCGFDALMVEAAPRALKRAAAWMAYVPAALRNVNEGPWRFEITVDEQRISTVAKMVLIANGSFVLQPRFELAPGIRTDDGNLDVLVFSPPNLVAATATASRLALGQLEGSPHVQHFRGRHATVESEPLAPVECDGDLLGTTPVDVRVIPNAISIIVPSPETRSGEPLAALRQFVARPRD